MVREVVDDVVTQMIVKIVCFLVKVLQGSFDITFKFKNITMRPIKIQMKKNDYST